MEDIEDVEGVMSDYEKFREIAQELDWFHIEGRHEYFSARYPLGLYLDAYEFPEGYVRENMAQAYVRGVMSSIGFYEEWNDDFWRMPLGERRKCLEQGKELYKSYAIPKELRMTGRDWRYLMREMEYFAGTDNVAFAEWKEYLRGYENALVIEIGGYCAGDYEYAAIKNDNILLVSCGVWD